MAETSLIKVAVSKKDEQTYSKTLLLNTNRILDMERNTGTGLADFFYDMGFVDLKNRGVKFNASAYTVNNLTWAINRADTTQNRFYVHVERHRQNGHQEIKKDKMVKLYADQIVYGYDHSDGLGCYLWILRGSDGIRLDLSHTLDDIIRAASKSASLSRSPMS